MSGPVLRTALTLLLEEAAPDLAAARAELDPVGAERIGLHITLLHPFVPREEITPGLVAELRDFFSERPVPQFALAGVEEFANVVAYVAPEPDGELKELMLAIWQRFPDYPPYGGEFDEPVPHATVASYDRVDVDLEHVRSRLRALLPVRCAVAAASLIEECEPDRWRELGSLPFGSVRREAARA